MATTRYMVLDVDEAVSFYTEMLGFILLENWEPAFAMVSRGDLTLWLSDPGSSAARPMPDGRHPNPGGWNRIVIEVDDIESEIARLKEKGASFRNQVVHGPGGSQVLIEDPSGNPVELFQSREN